MEGDLGARVRGDGDAERMEAAPHLAAAEFAAKRSRTEEGGSYLEDNHLALVRNSHLFAPVFFALVSEKVKEKTQEKKRGGEKMGVRDTISVLSRTTLVDAWRKSTALEVLDSELCALEAAARELDFASGSSCVHSRADAEPHSIPGSHNVRHCMPNHRMVEGAPEVPADSSRNTRASPYRVSAKMQRQPDGERNTRSDALPPAGFGFGLFGSVTSYVMSEVEIKRARSPNAGSPGRRGVMSRRYLAS
eukprot:925782-Rhodomonas_salina.1